MKNGMVRLLVYAVGFILVWNVLDFLVCTFITGGNYTFSIGSDMVTPLTLMLIIQVVEMNARKRG